MIYFQPSAQTKALSLFHFGLNTDGILFLGSSETPGELVSEFETIHDRNKVYRKWRQARLPAEIRVPSVRTVGRSSPSAALRSFALPNKSVNVGLLRLYDHLLSKYMPPSLLINEKRELVDSFGGAEKILRLPSRRPSLDVLDLIDPSIRTMLVGALQRVLKTEAQVRFSGVKMTGENGDHTYNLTVEPFQNPSAQAIQYLLTSIQSSLWLQRTPRRLNRLPTIPRYPNRTCGSWKKICGIPRRIYKPPLKSSRPAMKSCKLPMKSWWLPTKTAEHQRRTPLRQRRALLG